MPLDCHLDGRLAVALRVFYEIADHSSQQQQVATHHDWAALHGTILVSRAFFGRERSEVDVLAHVQLIGCIETAHEQDLVHELVELGDVLGQRRLALGLRVDQFEAEPQAG